MNLNDEAIQEEISFAVISTIIAKARYTFTLPKRDCGNDLEIQKLILN